jgi:hypothetical protein
VTILLALPTILLLSYSLWIQHQRGGWWKLCWLLAPPAYLLDVILAFTLFAIFFNLPHPGEYTISQMLSRLRHTSPVANALANLLNAIAPVTPHIQ